MCKNQINIKRDLKWTKMDPFDKNSWIIMGSNQNNQKENEKPDCTFEKKILGKLKNCLNSKVHFINL